MTKALSELLRGVIQRYGLEKAMLREQMPKHWAAVVGARLATISEIKSFEDGVLRVVVSDATWRMELTLRKEEIRHKLNDLIGQEAIKDLQVK